VDRDVRAVGERADRNVVTGELRLERRQIGRYEVLDHLAHAVARAALGYEVCALLQERQRVRDRDAQLAGRDQRVIVLCVADAERVVR
jgi:hypothetical protein